MPMLKRALFITAISLACYSALSYHRQLAVAATRASDRVNHLEQLLKSERDARRRDQQLCADQAAEAARRPPPPPPRPPPKPPPPPPPPPPPAPTPIELVQEAARMAMRQELAEAARHGLTIPSLDAAQQQDAKLEWAHFELREALAADDPGWCRCPPPPNVTKLCHALGILTADGTMSSEVNALRSAVMEANARVQEANDEVVRCRLRAERS